MRVRKVIKSITNTSLEFIRFKIDPKMKYIWVVNMHRTTKSQHSYVVGVYEDLEDAKKAGIIEENNRGGKYDADITRYFLNELPEELIDDETL